MKTYDVAIVGTGPYGMFTALELIKLKPELKIAMFDKGNFGGAAGSLMDGKLTLTHQVGGDLIKYLSQAEFDELMKYVDAKFVEFGGNEGKLFIPPKDKAEELKFLAKMAGLEFHSYSVRHLGSDNTKKIVMSIERLLKDKGVDIFTHQEIKEITPQFKILRKNRSHHYFILKDTHGAEIMSKYVFIGIGRSGTEQLSSWTQSMGITSFAKPVDVGVRLEVKAETVQHLVDASYDFKFICSTGLQHGAEQVRTFCVCPNGFVTREYYNPYGWSVNGHSLRNKKSNNTNFAILATFNFTEPFNDPTGYGMDIVRFVNRLNKNVTVQKLEDFAFLHHRSTWPRINDPRQGTVEPTLEKEKVTPGDIADMPYRVLLNILHFLQRFNTVAPGVYSGNTLIYAPEIKPYSKLIQADARKGFETFISGLYVGGDSSGYTRGLVSASMMGIWAARKMMENYFRS